MKPPMEYWTLWNNYSIVKIGILSHWVTRKILKITQEATCGICGTNFIRTPLDQNEKFSLSLYASAKINEIRPHFNKTLKFLWQSNLWPCGPRFLPAQVKVQLKIHFNSLIGPKRKLLKVYLQINTWNSAYQFPCIFLFEH